jgi:diguanylate cyclase (GGDEF)-like protein
MLDSLTGLCNPGVLLDHLGIEDHAAGRALIGFAVADLRAINARHGHAAGNRLLAELGRRLNRIVRPEDLAAHLGGGRFALAVAGACGRTRPERVRQRIAVALAQPTTAVVGAVGIRSSVAPWPAPGSAEARLAGLFRDVAREPPMAAA